MAQIFHKTKVLTDNLTHYCPGCTHGIAHRILAETLEELGIQDRTVGISPVGCSVMMYDYFDIDFQEAAHGRAPAMATGMKRSQPNLMVFTYQGDGDLASIGMGEIVHAANRGEKFTTIFINNAVYGMTGGQMAPTTLPGQRTTTSPAGRNPEEVGMPVRVAELLGALVTPGYIVRESLHSPKNVNRAKKAIKQAFEYQMANKCFTFVELLSTCPTNWGMTPEAAMKWVETDMVPYYPLGVIKKPE